MLEVDAELLKRIAVLERENRLLQTGVKQVSRLRELWTQALDQLRASEESSRLLFEASRDALLTLAPPSWKFTRANQATLDMFGAASPDEFNALGPLDISPERQPDGQPSSDKAQAMIALAMAEGSHLFEWQNQRLNGELFPSQILLSRMQIGEDVFIQASIRDITKNKLDEAKLEQYHRHLEELVEQRTAKLTAAEAHTRLILDSSADGLYGVDTQGNTTFINPAACQMLGYNSERLLGRHIHTLIHHSHPDGTHFPAADCPMNKTLQDGTSMRNDDCVFWHADGHPIPVAYATHPILEGNKITGAVVSFFDISAQKAAKAESERLAKLKHELLANMSHELRTPINAVLGFAQIGLRDSGSDQNADRFSRIVKAGQQLLGLVNDLLDFARIESGKLSIVRHAFNVTNLINQSVAHLRGQANDKGLKLQVELAHDLPPACLGDGQRIGQVLANLLDNAVKFTPTGNINLSARHAADTLILQVTDTGIGMTADRVRNLFQSFEQGDGSSTRKYGGTGLGLALCKSLVDLMAGEIRVTSMPGQGSTFEVRLPCPATNAQVPVTPAVPESNDLLVEAHIGGNPPSPEADMDPAKIDEFLQQLESLLVSCDTRAVTLLKENRAWAQTLDEPGKELVRHLEAFDFDMALTSLQAIRLSRGGY
jgi:PAS domain S-box-containing protein